MKPRNRRQPGRQRLPSLLYIYMYMVRTVSVDIKRHSRRKKTDSAVLTATRGLCYFVPQSDNVAGQW